MMLSGAERMRTELLVVPRFILSKQNHENAPSLKTEKKGFGYLYIECPMSGVSSIDYRDILYS